jgi:hypothetical protein
MVDDVPMMFARHCLLVVTVAAPAVARADQPSLHANAGLEMAGGSGVFGAGLRLHAGYGRSFGTGALQPTLAVGATFGWSSLRVEDPDAVEGKASVPVFEAGPELVVALRFAEGGWADNHLFVTAAWMYATADDEVQGHVIPGVESGGALRFGIGASWVGTVVDTVSESPPKSPGTFMWLVPQQLELVFVRSAGFDRYGAVLAWGI